jgi:hypothetical protein
MSSPKPDSRDYDRVDDFPVSTTPPTASALPMTSMNSHSDSAPASTTEPPASATGSTAASASSSTDAAAAASTSSTAEAQPTSLTVNVRTLTGQQIQCQLPADAPNTVEDLKRQVEAVEGIPPGFQVSFSSTFTCSQLLPPPPTQVERKERGGVVAVC